MADFRILNEYLVTHNTKHTELVNTRSYNVDKISSLNVVGYGETWYVQAVPVEGRTFYVDLVGTPFTTYNLAVAARDALVLTINT